METQFGACMGCGLGLAWNLSQGPAWPTTERVSITSKAEVLYDSREYEQQIDVTVVRSLANEITFISTTE